mmetsp:Transcript_59135/g.142509  ORF Transcript_59135/g.142509 Transcript_59135/m.142509 type:complete len:115 (-) Transcript_59135:22-366(-)
MSEEQLEAVLDRLVEDKFLSFLETFRAKNCQPFLSTGEEYTLKHTEIHMQYKRLFEGRIESSLKALGCSSSDFIRQVAAKSSEDGKYSDFAESLGSVEDFESFCAMMRQKAAEA